MFNNNPIGADKIHIKDLELYAFHGVLPEEKANGQTFIVSMTLFLDSQPAGENDDLDSTINYAEVCYDTEEFMSSKKYDLIETVAEKLAEKLLLKYSALNAINVEIKKPDAPIDLQFDYVSVEITRAWHTVYLGIGSNIGDKKKNFEYALENITQNPVFRNVIISDLIETKPYGPVEQDDFLNACIGLQTILSPKTLLKELKSIEKNSGREDTVRWGPRTLDLDILLYDNLILNEEGLIIPHADMHNRKFVLEPLSNIAPQVVHPVINKSISELLELLD